MNRDESVVLVVGSGMQRYREYLLASAAAKHTLWLFNATPPDWQSSYVAGSSVMDVYDLDLVIQQAKELGRQRDVVGVLSWDETLIVATAHLAQLFGLPGATIDGVEGCRDKHRNRRVLTEAGLPAPRFVMTYSAEEARAAAARIGYPVIVKPRGMGASIGVLLAESEEQIDAAFHIAEDSSREGARAYQGGALIEQYLTGPEISIDAAVVDGEYLPMFLARKEIGMYPHFEELGHIVDPNDPLLRDTDLHAAVAAAHRAIGFRFGMTHTEVKLTDAGPVIIEINGRMGGDLIPYLGRLATGIDPGRTAVEIALGNRPDLTPRDNRIVGIRFGYPPRDCRVESITTPAPDPELGLIESAALVGPGTELRLPPGGYIARHSYVIATADDVQSCQARSRAALDGVDLRWQPIEARTPETTDA
jgi:biotin carboxylase